MVRILTRLALVATCAAVLSVPALARDHGRSHRSRVVVVWGDRGPYYRAPYYYYDDYWVPGRRAGWRSCDLPPGLARRYGCYYDRPVIVVPRYPRHRYYRPRGTTIFFSIR